MTEPVRLAGRGRFGDATVTWTVAEGRRGRRWREAVAHGDGLVHSLLLETGPDGRFSHLELTTLAGLLTLHPEPDGTLHGNRVVTGDAVEPIAGRPFGPSALLVVAGSPISLAADAWALVDRVPVGASVIVSAAVVDETGRVTIDDQFPVERLGAGRWRIGEVEIDVDDRGVPVLDGPAPMSTEV